MRILILEGEATTEPEVGGGPSGARMPCGSKWADGWELFGLRHPDVVISDWHKLGLDGVERCERIRAVEWPAYTPFIFVTGLTDREHALAGIENGADDYPTPR